jgi:ABC-type Zn uptake system ZnuABC Zn-binding protein ZnuA
MRTAPAPRSPVRHVVALAAMVLGMSATRADRAVADDTAPAPPLQVCATIPDLGSLAEAVGGDAVTVHVFAKGTEDAHFVEARPSFVKLLSDADVYIQSGLDLEIGYAPLLLQQARNAKLAPDQPGFIDAAQAIPPLDVPTGTVDRSMGDVHAAGNPHYLLDPLNGVRVARLIADRLGTLRPERRAYFEERFTRFNTRVAAALVGEPLAKKYDVAKLGLLAEHGRLIGFLQEQGDAALLGGWLAALQPYQGTKAVDDHNMWPYFARRFGLVIVGHMEPKPGIPPTTSHLAELVARMKADGVRLIISAPYYDERHARFVAAATGATVATLAHMVGSRPGTDDYVAMFDYNVRELVRALGPTATPPTP